MAMRVLLAVWLGLATVVPAWALTPGGGSSATDCLAEFGGSPAHESAAGEPLLVQDSELPAARVEQGS